MESVHKRALCGGGQGGAAYTMKTIALEASHLFSSPPPMALSSRGVGGCVWRVGEHLQWAGRLNAASRGKSTTNVVTKDLLPKSHFHHTIATPQSKTS